MSSCFWTQLGIYVILHLTQLGIYVILLLTQLGIYVILLLIQLGIYVILLLIQLGILFCECALFYGPGIHTLQTQYEAIINAH